MHEPWLLLAAQTRRSNAIEVPETSSHQRMMMCSLGPPSRRWTP